VEFCRRKVNLLRENVDKLGEVRRAATQGGVGPDARVRPAH
jgi:hypothetical protein